MKKQQSKSKRCSKLSSKMAVYCGTSLPLRKQQQISNNLTDTQGSRKLTRRRKS